jgi:hypothetical protein
MGHGIRLEIDIRTARLVGGEHPYALIVDDYRKDNLEHL